MEDFVKLTLSRMDIGQVLDGLHERMLIWRATEEYFIDGCPQSADCIEECSDEHEARAIADYYQYLIDTIKKQLDTQQSDYKENNNVFYITLLHGRKTPSEEMNENGLQGPTFGPYQEIYSIYNRELMFLDHYSQSNRFHVVDGLIYYDGIYYGDWVVLCKPKKNQSITIFNESKAICPKS